MKLIFENWFKRNCVGFQGLEPYRYAIEFAFRAGYRIGQNKGRK